MLNKIIKILLIILFISLPLINSHFFDLVWINWWFYVDWNYEFSKVMFFNILSWIIISLFFIKNFRKKDLIIHKVIILLIFLIFINIFFSEQQYTSLLWNNSKGHSSLMFINIIWLFIVLINSSKDFLNKLVKYTIISSIFVVIIWLKEYFYPSFDYWNLSNRAFSTFWHPNYLALYILMLMPFFLNKKAPFFHWRKAWDWGIFILLFILLILTKSAWWIIIFLIYLYFPLSWILSPNGRKRLHFFLISWIILLGFIIYDFWILTKINSFLSRFYIWETTLNIIFSDIKIFLFWWWLGTLENIFDIHKVKELYIFENIWFTADRPHNIFLNFFYHFWIFWLSFLIFIFYKLIKNYENNSYYNSVILFFVFCFFNFPSIVHFLLIILFWSYILHWKDLYSVNNKYINKWFLISISIFSIFWIYFSGIYYYSEVKIKQDKSYISNNYFIQKIQSEDFENNLFKTTDWDFYKLCKNLTKKIPSVENYFYCWDLFWDFNNKDLAINYYSKWLATLPDMWNNKSIWYKNYLINKLFINERFYAKKFSNLTEILKRVWQK